MSTTPHSDQRDTELLLKIGSWSFDPAGNRLLGDAGATHLEPKAIEVLVYLALHSGRVVAREELLAKVWPGVVVGDDTLTQAIIKLRKALGDDARRPTYIETVSKRGYRLIAPVNSAPVAPPSPSPAASPQPPSSRRLQQILVPTAIAVVVAILAAAIFFRERIGPSYANSGQAVATNNEAGLPLVAVLPLVNQSGEPTREYFSDGITEDIIHALGRFSGIRVLSRNAVEPFKDRTPTPLDVKRVLGVRYVVTGRIREAGGDLLVSVELSDASSGILVWSERYRGRSDQVFDIQDRIVKDIAGALAVKVARLEDDRIASKRPSSLEAYDMALRARALLVKGDRAANREARALLMQAIKLSPAYAETYVLLSAAEIQRSIAYGWTEDPTQSLQQAEQFAQKALSLDDFGARARAHGQLATLHAIAGKYEQALGQADLAISLNPSDAFALDTRGETLLWLGRADEAINAMATAARLNPPGRGPVSAFALAVAYYTKGQYRESIATADKALANYADAAFLHAIRAASLAQAGDLGEARAAAARVRRFDPFFNPNDFGNRFVESKRKIHLQQGLLLAEEK